MTTADTNRRGPIVLVGGGKMGAALLAGWLAEGVAAEDVVVVEPHPATMQALKARFKIQVVDDVPAIFARPPTLVLFAVKPQGLDAVVVAREQRHGELALQADPEQLAEPPTGTHRVPRSTG